ncbi:MAG: Holliday junction resolvase RuvX [Candidatus Cloacimonetes bacterium]|nr:Holliday junction resolvase RuvX [Candidatus Cloacimonadota bacterium]
MTLNRYMAIDYGRSRVGIALSDPLLTIARPLLTLANDNEHLCNEISKIIELQNVVKIVVGLPLSMNGEDSAFTLEVREFASKLEKKLQIKVILWDERLSSDEARNILRNSGYSLAQSKKKVDQLAATLILQDYLDSSK